MAAIMIIAITNSLIVPFLTLPPVVTTLGSECSRLTEFTRIFMIATSGR